MNELIERLRKFRFYSPNPAAPGHPKICDEAADALEAAQAQCEEFRQGFIQEGCEAAKLREQLEAAQEVIEAGARALIEEQITALPARLRGECQCPEGLGCGTMKICACSTMHEAADALEAAQAKLEAQQEVIDIVQSYLSGNSTIQRFSYDAGHALEALAKLEKKHQQEMTGIESATMHKALQSGVKCGGATGR